MYCGLRATYPVVGCALLLWSLGQCFLIPSTNCEREYSWPSIASSNRGHDAENSTMNNVFDNSTMIKDTLPFQLVLKDSSEKLNYSITTGHREITPSSRLSRGGFPRWPLESKGINIMTILRWLNYTVTGKRLKRKFDSDNFPTIPAMLVSNNNDNSTGGKYSLIYAEPVVNTLSSSKFFRRTRFLPLQYIINKSINSFNGSKYINSRPLKRLYEILDNGLFIPLVLDISDMKQCATNYSVNYFDIIFEELPVWSFSTHVNCLHAFGLPFSYSWRGGRVRTDSSEWDAVFEASDQSYPWSAKERIAVWRGGGGGLGWRQSMVEMVSGNPLVDAQFAEKHQRIPFEDFQKYRTVMDVDGNAWSERFNKLLCMNTPVIKVQPTFLNYLDFTATPHVHFIPAPLNETLINVVNWTLAPENEGAVLDIMYNARAWCREHMTTMHVMEDVVFQLAAYVELLDTGSPGWIDQIVDWRRKNSTTFGKLFPHIDQLR